jgi:hypothetical protein
MPGMHEVASMWQGGLSQDPAEWLRQHDWQVSTTDRAALALSYGRPLSDNAVGGFLTASRQDSRAHQGTR